MYLPNITSLREKVSGRKNLSTELFSRLKTFKGKISIKKNCYERKTYPGLVYQNSQVMQSVDHTNNC